MDNEAIKTELNNEYEKISQELEGKSEEELKSMEKAAQEQINQDIHNEASEYVYNIMELGPKYTKEEFDKVIDDIAQKNLTPEGQHSYAEEHYTIFEEHNARVALEILNQGYRLFGKKFINNCIDKDPESAKVLFEEITQFYINLTDDIQETIKNAEDMIEKQKEIKNKNKNN